MTIYNSNNFKIGLKIIFENEPCCIESSEFIKPGKGQSFTRIKIRKLLTDQLLDRSFRSTEYFKKADIFDVKLLYLYNDNICWHFLNTQNFEQYSAEKKLLYKKLQWLIEQNYYMTTLWNNQIISVIPSNFVELKVIKTTPGIKGDSLNNNVKIAILNNNAKIKVPLFIKTGEIIKVDTRSNQYICRIKNN
ncbi:Elongation factor P [Buchnera aphidicola (Eriosoma grossulariae)]|uniref:elongation factor P n=1 Tax=Buchnera aphidicola TaxID=9 RepID=UPI003464E3C7